MKFNFTHQGISGTLTQSTWTGREKLLINGEEVQKTGKEWITQNGIHIESKKEYFLFPKLIINGNEIKLIKLRKWEWFFVILPGFLLFLGGAIPALIGIGGVYLNLSIFRSDDINPVVKILASLGYLIIALIIIIGVAVALQS
jgi:hypothetical protein